MTSYSDAEYAAKERFFAIIGEAHASCWRAYGYIAVPIRNRWWIWSRQRFLIISRGPHNQYIWKRGARFMHWACIATSKRFAKRGEDIPYYDWLISYYLYARAGKRMFYIRHMGNKHFPPYGINEVIKGVQ